MIFRENKNIMNDHLDIDVSKEERRISLPLILLTLVTMVAGTIILPLLKKTLD